MFTQESVNQFKASGEKFRNGAYGLNVNWGMYTVADLNLLLSWHVEYSPATRREAKHILRWLNYHACNLSWSWYENAFKDGEIITRLAINNANAHGWYHNSYNEAHYCGTTCEWLNRALKFLQDNPTPVR